MGHRHSRQIDNSSGVRFAERGCRGLWPCSRHGRGSDHDTLLPPPRGGLSHTRTRSDMFQSCEDFDIFADDLPHQNSQERLVKELGRSLEAFRKMKLSPDVEKASEKMLDDLRQLESIMEGVEVQSTAPPSCNSTAASDLDHDVRRAGAPKMKMATVVNAIRAQAHASLQPGALAPAMNQLITLLWPRIGTYVEELVRDSIEPSINASLPSLLKGGVKFTKVSLGQSSPVFGPIVVDHDEQHGAILVHIGIDFSSDLDVELHAVGIPIGIEKIFLKGELVCLLTPPMDKPPFFGGIQVYFPNPPDVGLNFSGAARVADVPGLRGAVRGAIDSAVAGVCVLPRRIAVDMNEDDDVDIIDLTYPEPIGVLRFTLWSGSNLIAADTHMFGAATSDPYVVATLGIKKWTSPTIRKTLDPEWGDGQGITVDFPVHDVCQSIALKVFDYDFASADDLIGVAQPVNARALVQNGPGKQILELLKENGEPGGGNLVISASLLSLAVESPTAPLAVFGPSEAHLSVKLLSIKGLESLQCDTDFPFKVRIQVRGDGPEVESDKTARNASRPSSFSVTSNAKTSQASKANAMKSQKTVAFDGPMSNDHVFVEGITSASHPVEQKQLADAFRGIAKTLKSQGHDANAIADILDVSVSEVDRFLRTLGADDEGIKKQLKEQQQAQVQRLSVRQPRFEEVVQILLPNGSVDDLHIIELTVLDKRQKSLATATIPMSHVLAGDCLEGPWTAKSSKGVDVTVNGSLRLKWLA